MQAGVAGAVGAAIAIGAWIFAIRVLSGIAIVVGGFGLVMAVLTFVRVAARR